MQILFVHVHSQHMSLLTLVDDVCGKN